jgi:heme-degrading monooxygenase HmoA
MFSVLFEVHPRPERFDDYLAHARLLRPELERVDGIVDNVRYRSLTRPGWILSLSGWRDEKALVRWRTHGLHHGVQEKGRTEVFLDYHLRVGEVAHDTRVPAGQSIRAQRLDETEAGAATTVTLVDAMRPAEWVAAVRPEEVGTALGLVRDAPGLVAWDVFDAVLQPGEVVLMLSWRDRGSAEAFEKGLALAEGARLRRVRVVRDYGMFDRREAPQYYPEVEKPNAVVRSCDQTPNSRCQDSA